MLTIKSILFIIFLAVGGLLAFAYGAYYEYRKRKPQ